MISVPAAAQLAIAVKGGDMETKAQPKLQEDEKEIEEMPVTDFPGVEAYCRALKEQGIEYQIIPMRSNQSSKKET